MKVTYLTEDPGKEWISKIRECKNWTDLSVLTSEWRNVWPEAYFKFQSLDPDFAFFKEGVKHDKENSISEFMRMDEWMDKFGEIFLPMRLIKSTLLAERFKTPWGTAYIRLNELIKKEK